jgi:hypothetical protein
MGKAWFRFATQTYDFTLFYSKFYPFSNEPLEDESDRFYQAISTYGQVIDNTLTRIGQ